jgi:hypothetical protein
VDEPSREDSRTDAAESTDEYSEETLKYSAHLERGDAPASSEPPEPAWKRNGFESLKGLQNLGSPLPKGTRVPTVELPGEEVGDIGSAPAGDMRRRRQVSVKLRAEDLERET